MPGRVDHDQRRAELAAIALRVVAREGLDALTFRRIAAAAEASTTILTHYFAGKDDLLLATFRLAAVRSGERFDRVRGAGGDLRACLESILPLDAERRDEWRVRACFWAASIGDARLAAEEKRFVRSAHTRVETMLREGYEGMDDAEVAPAARRLITLVHGLGARNAVDARAWPAAEQRRLLDQEVRALAGLGFRPVPTSR